MAFVQDDEAESQPPSSGHSGCGSHGQGGSAGQGGQGHGRGQNTPCDKTHINESATKREELESRNNLGESVCPYTDLSRIDASLVDQSPANPSKYWILLNSCSSGNLIAE